MASRRKVLLLVLALMATGTLLMLAARRLRGGVAPVGLSSALSFPDTSPRGSSE